jgi:2'-hydroxyisoflavone reductase
MRILILGGTMFLGRWIASSALARGHTLTLFNRGSRPGLFPGVEEIHGDREKDLDLLAGQQWDAVVDTCGYVPRVVRKSVEALQGAVQRYLFISSISVYASSAKPDQDEHAPLGQMEDESLEDVNAYYGPLKALCERVVQNDFSGPAIIVRPGLIVGPYDPTDRFTYWPHRVARGGEVLAPGDPERGVQFIDVRDLSEWLVRLLEAGERGIYNATGPDQPLPMGDLLETCRMVSCSDACFKWVPEEFLLRRGVEPWIGLPLWLPESDPESAGFFQFDCRKAIAAGLQFRPLADTVRATLTWDATRLGNQAWRAGISQKLETQLLEEYQKGS